MGTLTIREPMEEALTRIRGVQMRVTKPRMAIIRSMQQLDRPVSIERLHQEIGKDACDLVTIYRCMTAFESLGLVRRIYRHDGACMFELNLSQSRHSYVVCRTCGQTERVDSYHFEGIEQMLQERGYAQIDYMVQFFGVCTACQHSATAHPIARSVMPHAPIGPLASSSLDSACL